MSGTSYRRRTAVIGTGAIAAHHAAAVAALGDRAEVVSCTDIDPGRAAAFAQKWSVPAVRASVDEVLELDRPDLVLVCTPPGTHLDLARRATAAGAAVLLEKPPAISLAETDALVQVQEESGLAVSTIVQHRFGSAAARVRRLSAEGVLGRALVATCDTLWFRGDDYYAVPWRGRWEVEGGGPTMGLGIHQYDMLMSLLGPWREVRAVAARQTRPTDTEDVSAAVVTFECGAVATVVNSAVSPRETSAVRIDFEHATVELEHLYGYDDSHWRFTPARGHEQLAERWPGEGPNVPSGHTAQFTALFDAMDAGHVPPADMHDLRVTMDLAASIYASAFADRTVARGELAPGDPFYEVMGGKAVPWPPVKAALR